MLKRDTDLFFFLWHDSNMLPYLCDDSLYFFSLFHVTCNTDEEKPQVTTLLIMELKHESSLPSNMTPP